MAMLILINPSLTEIFYLLCYILLRKKKLLQPTSRAVLSRSLWQKHTTTFVTFSLSPSFIQACIRQPNWKQRDPIPSLNKTGERKRGMKARERLPNKTTKQRTIVHDLLSTILEILRFFPFLFHAYKPLITFSLCLPSFKYIS